MTTFTIPIPQLVSGNVRLHWAERARRVRLIRGQVALLATSERTRLGRRRATTSCALTLTLIRGKGQHLLDVDNMYAALKPVLDGLVDAGWLVDDRPGWCVYTANQARDNAVGPAVIVQLDDPGGAANQGVDVLAWGGHGVPVHGVCTRVHTPPRHHHTHGTR
jgi:hypothetical protein